MRTVELLLDPALERGVVALWDRLHEAGLPSLATHGHPTNRPHLTVVNAASLDGLTGFALPIPVTLGAVVALGRAVVRAVEPDARLSELHERIWSSLTDAWPPPSEWTPHVSVALRVRAEERDAVLETLSGLPPARGFFVAARSYDSNTRTVRTLTP